MIACQLYMLLSSGKSSIPVSTLARPISFNSLNNLVRAFIWLGNFLDEKEARDDLLKHFLAAQGHFRLRVIPLTAHVFLGSAFTFDDSFDVSSCGFGEFFEGLSLQRRFRQWRAGVEKKEKESSSPPLSSPLLPSSTIPSIFYILCWSIFCEMPSCGKPV